MKYAVRYLSKSGNTKKVADAIAKELGVEAVSVTDPEAPINEKVDVLFIGGALYAYGIDKKLKGFIDSLDKENVGKVAAFSTAMISMHAVDLIKCAAKAKDINVQEEALFIKSRAINDNIENVGKFARRSVE